MFIRDGRPNLSFLNLSVIGEIFVSDDGAGGWEIRAYLVNGTSIPTTGYLTIRGGYESQVSAETALTDLVSAAGALEAHS